MFIGDWQWLDWANAPGVVDWVAFGLGFAGIGFTVFQLVRSRGALRSAEAALKSTRRTLIKNQLVSILPGFREISMSVDAALPGSDRDSMLNALTRFSYHAIEAATLLKASPGSYGDLPVEILRVANDANAARASLFGSPGESVFDLAAEAAAGIRDLALRISAAAVQIRNDPGNSGDANA